MIFKKARIFAATLLVILSAVQYVQAQNNTVKKINSKGSVYAGIEVGAKGVKLSVIEMGKNAQSSGAINIVKDSSVNTDFISFTQTTFDNTVNGFAGLYNTALKDYEIPAKRIFTVISSGVKGQAEKEAKTEWINNLIKSFKEKINEPDRTVEVVDVQQEAILSHLGIVPESRRYTTFLIDIGSGNTKGGYFPNGNTKDFKLFQLNWGTKSTTNAADKLCENDKSLTNYSKQLTRVLRNAENADIVYAVNESGAYPASDYVAFSGGIAWATATLIRPEAAENPVITVTYDEVQKFYEKLYSSYPSFSETALVKNINVSAEDKTTIAKNIKRVNGVFDQKAMLAGVGLLLKIMRQFETGNGAKQFYLIKNGQVGWVSAYVDQAVK